ncbi:MAG: serine/threonine-protein kinase [Pseudomonadota bacterium]
MSRRKGPPDLRAKSILERLSGSSDALDELGEDSQDLAERLKEIEQLFVLHGGERPMADDEVERPTLFSWGHLQVLEPIGSGSFGEVFLAHDGILDRDVALKLLKTGEQRPFQSQLFLHEARQLAMVRHPNVLAVHGAAIHDARPGLWCDLIEGKTLSDSEAELASFQQADWLNLIESLVLGLQAVHDAGLLHGDVKPSNIMRDRNGQWVLMDFGASLDRQPDPGGLAMTTGTPLYMAPEGVMGQSPSTAADFYSLGATLYRMMSDQPVYAVKDWTELASLQERSTPIDWTVIEGSVSGPVSKLVRAMLAFEPAARPDAIEILAEIESTRTAPQRRFRSIAVAAVTGSLLLGLVFTGWGLVQANQARTEAEQEQRNTAAVNAFLQRLLSAPDDSGQVRDMTVEAMLDFAAGEVRKELDGQPEAQAAVHLALAESYEALSLSDETLEQARLGLAELEKIEPINTTLRPALELEIIAALESRGSTS